MKLLSLRSLVLGTMLALATATAVQAQTLVVARGADGNSLDPHEARSFEAIKIADWMYDGLVRFDGNTPNIVPALKDQGKSASQTAGKSRLQGALVCA